MSDGDNELAGSCHCGNIFYRLRTERNAAELPQQGKGRRLHNWIGRVTLTPETAP